MKIFDRQFEGKQPKRINEDLWFKQQQKMLLWMANTDYGRDLLCIDKRLPKIIDIGKQHVTGLLNIKKSGKLYQIQKITDFRVGAKWANVIRYRWLEFQKYAQVYYAQNHKFQFQFPVLMPVAPVPGFAYATTTVYPDPNPETTTMDGQVENTDVDWATTHDAATGDAVNDTAVIMSIQSYHAGTAKTIIRAFTYFDTSGIGATDSIDATTYSLWPTANVNEDNDGNDFITVVQVQGNLVSSNTGLTTADFDLCGSAISNPTEGVDTGGRKDITSLGTGAYEDFTLNATGRGWVARSGEAKPAGATNGITYLGSREGHDVLNIDETVGMSRSRVSSADEAATTQDPKLVVTHSAAVAAVSISNLLLMGV